MTSPQLDLARRGIEAYNSGDLDALVDLFTEDAVFVVSDGLPNAGTYRGREEFLQMIATWNEAWGEFRIEIDDMIEHGDAVVVPITQFGRGRGSGIEIQMTGAHLMRVRDGRMSFWQLYESREQALSEAGAI